MDIFVYGEDGQYNLRFVRRIYRRRCGGSKTQLCAELDDTREVDLDDDGALEWLHNRIIPGTGIARVVHWVWKGIVEPKDITFDMLDWYKTHIVGWCVGVGETPRPILVHPPASNGSYVIEEPNGHFTTYFGNRLETNVALHEWALDLARSVARRAKTIDDF